MLGVLDFDQGTWCIAKAQPHVAIRLKHMFRGIKAGQRPPFYLKDTPDRAADLDWFMQRYPLSCTPPARDALERNLERHRARAQDVERLLRPDYSPPEMAGFRAPEKPFAYQNRAAALWRRTSRLLLLDDVGLGKTVSALAGLADGFGLPAAIIVQTHLSAQWVQYIHRFTHLRAFEVKDRNPRTLPPNDVYVFRYSNIAAWADYAETLGIKAVVFDEIQEVRHGPTTDKGRGGEAFAAVADHVLGLTATPIYNYGAEIFNIVEIVAPGALGTWDEFIQNWCRPQGTHWVVEDPEALGAFLQSEGLVLRRTCADAEVALSLPPLSKSVLEVPWDDGDVVSDHDLQRRLALSVINGSFVERGQAARELNLMMRHDTGLAKARAAAAYVRTLVEGGEPVVLAGWHRAVYRMWTKALEDLRPVLFTGSESTGAKTKAKDAFCKGETDVLIMSLRSGVGLDGLQHRAAHIVFGEFDWSPQVHVQVIGRLHRQGQSRPVTAHYLHVDGGSDPVIMSALGLKASQSHGILNPYGGASEATPVDQTRIRQLAEAVLNRGAEVAE